MKMMLYLDLLLEKGAVKAPKKLYVQDLPCVFAHVRHGSLAGQPQFYSLSIRLLQLFFCDLCKCNSYTQVQASEANLYGSVKFTQAMK